MAAQAPADTAQAAAERYPFPHNSSELERLKKQHEWFKLTLGPSVQAPIDFTKPNMKILDSGCSNGNWLLDISSSLPPSTTYVGTDVAPHLFANNGPNFAFHVQTVTSPWPASWTSTFDFIHQRLVLSNIPPQSALPAIENLSKLLKPGGYIQLVEPDASSYEGEDRPAHRKLIAVYKEVWEKMGGNVRPGPDLKRWLEEAGLERVEEKVVELNLGAISENKALGEQWVENILTVVEHFKTSVQKIPGISFTVEELDQLGRDLKPELDPPGGSGKFYIAWGRKSGS